MSIRSAVRPAIRSAIRSPIARDEGVKYPAGTIFVSKSTANGFGDGDDSRTSTEAQNRATPWATISKAVASAPKGSLVVINDGEYSGLELGALNYALMTNSQQLNFRAHRRRQVTFLGTASAAVLRYNSSTSADVSTHTGIVFDGDSTSNYAVVDNSFGGVVHTLNFVDCEFKNTLFHGMTGTTTALKLNLYGCDFTSATRGYLSFTALGANAEVNIVGGSSTITATNNASPCINIKATEAGASVSISGGFACDVTLSGSLTGTGAHNGIVLTNISIVVVNGNTVRSLGNPGSRSSGCVVVTADAAVDVAATVTNNVVYNETTGGYGILVGADGSTDGDDHVIDPIVTGNTITGVTANQVTPIHGILAGFNQGGSILRNTVAGCGLALIQKMNTETGALFALNTILDCYSLGMYAKGAVGTRFVNNSVYAGSLGGSNALAVLQSQQDDSTTPSTGIEFTNNAIHVAADILSKFANVGSTSDATFENNLYFSDFALPANPFTYGGTSYASVALWAAAQEATAVSGDPLFTDAADDDFTLLAGSAAIGAGVAASGVTTDKAGVTYASPPSIGAYEYVG